MRELGCRKLIGLTAFVFLTVSCVTTLGAAPVVLSAVGSHYSGWVLARYVGLILGCIAGQVLLAAWIIRTLLVQGGRRGSSRRTHTRHLS